MRIALVDDQPEERNRLSQMIQKHLSAVGTNIRHIDTYQSAEDFLSVWKTGMYDLIFMDIYFDKTALSGIDAARKIRETDQAVLLGNLLENAMDACLTQATDNRRIAKHDICKLMIKTAPLPCYNHCNKNKSAV